MNEEKYTLNILNGQSMHDYIKQHHFDEDGIYVPFNEAMCVGEVTSDIFSKEFNICRCSAHCVTMDQYNEITLKPLQIFFEKEFPHIILWFDDDMFCQINLLTLLAYLNQINYKNKITFNLVSRDFKVLDSIDLNAQGYSKTYKQVMINRCVPKNVDLSIMSNGINLYFEYLKEENEITAYIRRRKNLEIDDLVTELLKTFIQYGLGDTQYITLINKCRSIT
jgi:hypothetical protein